MSEEIDRDLFLAASEDEAGETSERYVIDVGPMSVQIIDTRTQITVRDFRTETRLADALAVVAELNVDDRRGFTLPKAPTPREFLTETLPAYARQQRVDALRAELRDVYRRLEAALEALSALGSAERASVMGQDTLRPTLPSAEQVRNLSAVEAAALAAEMNSRSAASVMGRDALAAMRPLWTALSKPGPY